MQQFNVRLSRLIPGKRNPRRVKPAREAHMRLVALIRSMGLIQPLVVRPVEGKPSYFEVFAGNRRLAALRDIHRESGDPAIPCVLRKVDAETAAEISLGENFGQEPMHPLDEAEAFSNLASSDGKDATAIASDFGVNDRYVRQRMKLATLAEIIKEAYRTNAIDTSTAEAFAAVPVDRQLEVWNEVHGKPHNAEHVKNIIANEWIDGELALFDRTTLPESVVSQDLFGNRVIIERQAFLEAQTNALIAEQNVLNEDGWSEAVVGKREDVQDRLLSMQEMEKEYTSATMKKLAKIESDFRKMEKAARNVDPEDEKRMNRLQSRFDAFERKREQIEASAPVCFSEATKAKGTVFLILDPDGRVHREYRKARSKPKGAANGGHDDGSDSVVEEPKPPTSDDLGDRQLAVTFTHQALCVRAALYKDALARKRILVLLLHDKVRSEALAIRQDANGTTLHANSEGFKSGAHDRIQAIRTKLDPFGKLNFVDDVKAYQLLGELSEKKLDALIDVLVVQLITAHPQRPTALVALLAEELKINVRGDWTPDADWLGGFQKIQLAHLVTELKGVVHAPSPERKKSDLVSELAGLFASAADGKLEDKALADTVNRWLPANMRENEGTS